MEQPTVPLLARTVRGLEWVAAEEVARTLPATGIRLAERGVLFRIPADQLPAVRRLRAVDDVFLQVAEVPAGRGRRDVGTLAAAAAGVDLPAAVEVLRAARDVPAGPPFDVVANLDGDRRYNRFEVEEAVGGQVAARYGWRWIAHRGTPPAVRPEVTLRLLVEGDRALLAVRVAALPLHRRDYKVRTGRGSLHPPLAFMLTALADLRPGDRVGDPFCGDGTILLEVGRADVERHGCDLDPDRVRNAAGNARQADSRLPLVIADAGALPYRDGAWSRVVTNPPWNVAVRTGGHLHSRPAAGWREIRRVLRPDGRAVLLVGADDEVEPQLLTAGLPVGFQQTVRVSGRVGRILLLGGDAGVPPALEAWRLRAVTATVITDGGF